MAVVQVPVLVRVVGVRKLLRTGAEVETFELERQRAAVTGRCARPWLLSPRTGQLCGRHGTYLHACAAEAGFTPCEGGSHHSLHARTRHVVNREKYKGLPVHFQEPESVLRVLVVPGVTILEGRVDDIQRSVPIGRHFHSATFWIGESQEPSTR